MRETALGPQEDYSLEIAADGGVQVAGLVRTDGPTYMLDIVREETDIAIGIHNGAPSAFLTLYDRANDASYMMGPFDLSLAPNPSVLYQHIERALFAPLN